MENKLARFFRNTGPMRFFIPLGIMLIVMGIIIMSKAPKQYAETAGTITRVQEYEETDSEGIIRTYYEGFFNYTVDGKSYENSFDGYTEAPKTGDKLTVYYDPANPEAVSNTKHTGLISVIMIVVGVAAIALSILFGVKAFRKQKALDDQIKAATGRDTVPTVTPLPKEELTEYYVSFDGKAMKPGYIVEDKARNVVYKAEMTKNAAVGARKFTFTDRRLARTAEHEVGHTMTQGYSNEIFSTKSWFKFDGENIWDLLHQRGVRIATDLHSIFPRAAYTISVNGSFLATVETTGKYVHEEDEAQHKVNIPVGRYYYRMWTNDDNLELLFLTVFAISETEQAVVE